MAPPLTPRQKRGQPADTIPPLLPGDHLDRLTFHERYEAMPEGPKAERVGGVVYLTRSNATHARVSAKVAGWLDPYQTATPGVAALGHASVLLADDGEPQPDACLIIEPERGGQSRYEDDYLAGAPELVVEVAYSSDAYDLHSKKRDYERAGVREYAVVLLREERVVWFVLRGGRYEPLEAGEGGLFRSEVFPGLWLDPAALLRLDSVAVRRAVQQGLETNEHAAFAARLAELTE